MNMKILSAFTVFVLTPLLFTPQTGQSQSAATSTAVATVEVAAEMGKMPSDCGQLAEPIVPDPNFGRAIGAWPIWVALPNNAGNETRGVLGMPDQHYIKDSHLEGWWAMKVGWAIKDTYKGEVKVQGFNVADHSPIYFQFAGDPVTTAVLNPAKPGGSASGLNLAFFPSYVWVSKAGCYRIQAEWDGGSWQQVIAVGAAERAASATQSVILSGPVEDAPVGCAPRDVAQRLNELFAAINMGEPDIVPQFFGNDSISMFSWYSMTRIGPGAEKDHFAAYDLKELAAYFVKRHQQHEHLRLVRLQVNSWQGDLVHFGPITLMRSADDLHFDSKTTEYEVGGKGAMSCKQKTFLVLSLAMNIP
jgi:hypothetical protein